MSAYMECVSLRLIRHYYQPAYYVATRAKKGHMFWKFKYALNQMAFTEAGATPIVKKWARQLGVPVILGIRNGMRLD